MPTLLPTVRPVIRVASHAVALARLPLDVARVVADEVTARVPLRVPGQRRRTSAPAAAAPVAPEPVIPEPGAPDPVIPGPGVPGPGPATPVPPLPDPDVPPPPTEPMPEPAPEPVGQVAQEALAETHEAFATEAHATSRADLHGDGPTDPREVASWHEMADEVLAADRGEALEPDEAVPAPVDDDAPLLDASTAKSVRREAARMAKAADPRA